MSVRPDDQRQAMRRPQRLCHARTRERAVLALIFCKIVGFFGSNAAKTRSGPDQNHLRVEAAAIRCQIMAMRPPTEAALNLDTDMVTYLDAATAPLRNTGQIRLYGEEAFA